MDGMFNPINQYEQAYMYYRYMAQMMDYKIKCKEYEKMCGRQDETLKSSKRENLWFFYHLSIGDVFLGNLLKKHVPIDQCPILRYGSLKIGRVVRTTFIFI